MNIEKWIIAHFSPTGGTKRVADAIAAGFFVPVAEMDLTKADSAVTLGESDGLMAVLPVFAGRVPQIALERLSALKGSGQKAVAVVVYGNREFDDALLETKPPYSPPYIHDTAAGRRVSFQTWNWDGDHYRLTQYIIDDEEKLEISKFDCEYRATRREEMTNLLIANGCNEVTWLFPEETGFYQPMVIAKK